MLCAIVQGQLTSQRPENRPLLDFIKLSIMLILLSLLENRCVACEAARRETRRGAGTRSDDWTQAAEPGRCY